MNLLRVSWVVLLLVGLAGINAGAFLSCKVTGPPPPGQEKPPEPKPLLVIEAPRVPLRSTRGFTPVFGNEAPGEARNERNPGVLAGSVLVLVLTTKTSKRSDPTLDSGLRDLQSKHADKLLGRCIYCLTPKACLPLSSTPLGEPFENRDFDRMFQQAFREIEKLAGRARDSRFKVVLVWETDVSPDSVSDKSVNVPTGREFRLLYRFTDRDEDSSRLEEWFGRTNTARAGKVDDLPRFVEFYLNR